MTTMSSDANPLSEGDIEATNVLPAFETSLRFGATEPELASVVGWRRAELTRPGARVNGSSTYAHMELMYSKPAYPELVISAAAAHDGSSLGIVGLACKTMANVGAAMACHARFQHLTNRTARYETIAEGDSVILREHRPGERRLGSMLISEYTMFVALHLLSVVSRAPPKVRAMRSRRLHIPEKERRQYDAFLGVEMSLGADNAELVLDRTILGAPIVRADPELEAYFLGVLARAEPPPHAEPALLADVRTSIRGRLSHGAPTVGAVARAMGMGERTLQRRLASHGVGFGDLLDETRRDAAEGYLRTSKLSLPEIAYLLGYSEQASFYRAFRRWHPVTPDAFRQAHASGECT